MRLELQIDDEVYSDFLHFLKLVAKNKIKILKTSENKKNNNVANINKYAGSIKTLPIDPLKFQEQMRNEWE